MLLTKTEVAVLKLFVSLILDSFTIRGVSRLISKDLKIVHSSIKKLIKKGFLVKDKHNALRLDYKHNAQDLAYIENIRKEDFFKKNPLIKIHINTFLDKTKNKFFILMVFGSYASGKTTKKSDIDLLAVLPFENEEFERQFKASLSVSTKYFHTNFISEESFREMLHKRDETNVVNETFNNHILLYGAEQYYALLGERDVRWKKAKELMLKYDFEMDKRAQFTYNMGERAKLNKASTSLKRAVEFYNECLRIMDKL